MLDRGGAISCDPCNLIISGSVFRANTSSSRGGAVYFGGWDAGHSLRIFHSRFAQNNAESGGALYIAHFDPQALAYISSVSFYDNLAAHDGGAIFHGSHQSDSELFIVNSTFHENSAGAGGALYTGKDTVTTVSHVTFVENDAGWGSSIYGVGKTNLYNSIAVGGRNEECYGSLVSAIGTIDSDGSCDPLLRDNPRLGDLIEPEAGSLGYFPLLPDSPAIDAVDCDRGIPTDQIGNPRPQGSACDIGAIEYVPPVDAED